MVPSTHGLLAAGAAYSNLSFRGLSGPSASLAGPCLPPAANRYCIIPSYSINGGVFSFSVNGLPVTVLSAGSVLGLFIANVGTRDNAAHNGGYDFTIGSGIGQLAVFDVYMTSAVPHSLDVTTLTLLFGNPTSVFTTGAETIPANGFAFLLAAGSNGALVSTNQGFTIPANGIGYVEKATAFSGTIDLTLGGASSIDVPMIFASFAGDGS
jgi:hypothetical protein